MDDREKAELNKQKKLVDCVSHLNSVLEAFERLENYKATVLPIIDGFDLTHSDTYLELTENIKRELFYIKFFSEHATSQLVKYRRLCHPEPDIYSIKDKKNREKYGLKPLGDWKKQSEEMQCILNERMSRYLQMAGIKQTVDETIRQRAEQLEGIGIKAVDALHVACAEASNSDYFLTCDKRLINRCVELPVKTLNPVDFILEIEDEDRGN